VKFLRGHSGRLKAQGENQKVGEIYREKHGKSIAASANKTKKDSRKNSTCARENTVRGGGEKEMG